MMKKYISFGKVSNYMQSTYYHLHCICCVHAYFSAKTRRAIDFTAVRCAKVWCHIARKQDRIMDHFVH